MHKVKSLFVLSVMLVGLLSSVSFTQTFNETGFNSEIVTVLPAYEPVGLTWAPDGRMFIWQENGSVRIYKNGVLLPTPFIDLSARVNVVNDRGMLGLALDPSFATNGYVYLLYTYEPNGNSNDPGPKTARLTRVTANPANPDVALSNSEIVLLGTLGAAPCSQYPAGADCIGNETDSHAVNTLRFDKDGKLYVSIGDGASYTFADPLALRSQNLSSYNGKLLRINRDGSAPSDNPFYDGTNSIKSKVYAYGLRNPYRFGIHPSTGEVMIGDVGWNTWEEINRGRGKNFGWPCYEGNDAQQSYQSKFAECRALAASAVTKPLYTYTHHYTEGWAVIGGAYYTATQFPTQYRGNFFFADYVSGWIRRLVFDASNNLASVVPFVADAGGIVSLELGPDGALYYIELASGQVRRIRYTSAPVAVASAAPTAGLSPLTVNFSSTGSSDPNGSPLTYLWNFGDGATSTLPHPTHTYSANTLTTFTARLTVTNNLGLSATAEVAIKVGNSPPVATITAPLNNAKVSIGSTVVLGGTATDSEEILTASSYKWQVLLHHDAHVHPYILLTGPTASFVVEDHAQGKIDYFFEIVLTVTDSGGLTNTKRVMVYPTRGKGK